MKIHNILEDQVITRVNDMYDNLANIKPSWFTCNCEQCRLDAAAYVLNKLPPRYVVSGRGLTHMLASADTQISADMDALVIEGIKRVAANARPFHAVRDTASLDTSKGPFFNFPVFIGTVYDGTTFEPIHSAEITLSKDGRACQMFDHTWTNPVSLTLHTKGKYTFWVKPEKVQTINKTKHFQFKIEITADGFDKTVYTVDIPITSAEFLVNEPSTIESVKIQDLYLFPKYSK